MVEADPLRDLLDRTAEGDDVALSHLVRRTQGDVWRLCSALGSNGEVDDLVQDTYLRLIKAAPSYRGESSVRTWLLAIARHVCADHVRRRQRQRRLVDRLVERTDVSGDGGPGVEDRSGRLSLDGLGLDRLSPERREAFVLTQVLDLSYDDAAGIMGCPVGTIRSRVARAREDLLGVHSADASIA